MNEWQPIETAPRGEWIVVTVRGMSRGYYEIVFGGDGFWLARRDDLRTHGQPLLCAAPTHWMSLPDPPK